MLRALSIENIAVAKNLDIEFDSGFTVLTGETGAGKSIIIDSISLLLGAKGQRDLIRHGASKASVTAIFSDEQDENGELSEIGVQPDENGELTLLRTLSADGRSGAKINGKSVSLSLLRECAEKLLALHGQEETASLYDPRAYIRVLDDYGESGSLLQTYSEIYDQMVGKRSEIHQLHKSMEERSMMIDILKYQLAEIDKARITSADEEEKLIKLRDKLRDREVIAKNAGLVYRALAPSDKGASAAYLLERAAAALHQLGGVMEGAEEAAGKLMEYRIEVIDIAERARDVIDLDELDGEDPDRQLDRIEGRLNLLSRLKKKYGGSLPDVIAFRENAAKKLHDIEFGESRLEELEREYKQLAKKGKEAADALSAHRRESAVRLGDEVMDTLRFLDMPKVRFYVEIRPLREDGKEKFTALGTDEVDFTVVTNPGDAPQSLSKTASGGEMSRIMLALKSAQAKKTGAGTVIFDEIDTGVSGGTSERIGIKLRELSKGAQVICVTHSAQVAAHAHQHLLIEKKEVDGRAESSVRTLAMEERIGELARIIGGIEVTENQYTAAKELLKNI
ncbi:MAG: DNA repair protein RecN [Clostridiales bacterium]|nr:DNA repair protein RecN [Clostridiales bacterium]